MDEVLGEISKSLSKVVKGIFKHKKRPNLSAFYEYGNQNGLIKKDIGLSQSHNLRLSFGHSSGCKAPLS